MSELLDRLEHVARRQGHAPAFFLDQGSISIEETNAYANRLARWLQSGRHMESRVIGVCARASLLTPAVLFGVLKAGKAFVGLDPAYSEARLRHMVERSGCRVVITDASTQAADFGQVGKMQLSQLTNEIAPLSSENPRRSSLEDAPAYVTFTSGSTGPPKAVIAPMRQVDNRFLWMWESYPFAAGEVCCHRMPLSFVDTVWELLGPICEGVPVALIPNTVYQRGASLVHRLAQCDVSRVWMLPAAINDLVEQCPALGASLPRLRFWVSTGDALSRSVADKFRVACPQGRLFNLYGTSEVWDATWFEVPRQGVSSLCVPLGEPIRKVDLRLVGGAGEPTRLGDVGEILVGGEGLALGYLTGNDISALPAHDVANGPCPPYYPTGDLGRFSRAGELEFLGREQGTVERGGEFIRQVEVEAALTLHPLVRQGAVWAEERTGDVRVSAYYSTRVERELDPLELSVHLRDYLPVSWLPDRFVRLREFPLTPSGKIDRRRLMEYDGRGELG